MDSWPSYLVFLLLAGGGTFCFRAIFVSFLSGMDLSPGFVRLLSYIPASVLTAIIAPTLFLHQGSLDALMGKERLVAAVIAALVAVWTKSVLATLFTGMGVLYLLKYIF